MPLYPKFRYFVDVELSMALGGGSLPRNNPGPPVDVPAVVLKIPVILSPARVMKTTGRAVVVVVVAVVIVDERVGPEQTRILWK